jgi:hypothetical protein
LYPIHWDIQRGLCSQIADAAGSQGYDLIIMHNVLGETFLGKSDRITARTQLVKEALELLGHHGTVMLIEPALRGSSRELHHVRDCLLQEKACTLYSPCLHDGPCPALSKPTDWCHEERPWIAPEWIKAIDREVGFIKDALKFSYALLRKDGQTLARRGPATYRMVSDLRRFKGEMRGWLCNETGRQEVGRLNKDRSETNLAFEQSQRGTILTISSIVRKEKDGRVAALGRIPATATVERAETQANVIPPPAPSPHERG